MKHCGTQTLETPRLLLRPLRMDDCEMMFNNWAGDADYSAAWRNVEMRYDARIEGEYYYSEGFFLSVQDGQPITVTLTFDARLAE